MERHDDDPRRQTGGPELHHGLDERLEMLLPIRSEAVFPLVRALGDGDARVSRVVPPVIAQIEPALVPIGLIFLELDGDVLLLDQ